MNEITDQPMTDEQLWGCGEIEPFIPPAEVCEQILDDPEIAIDYPDIYEQAVILYRKEKSR